MAGFSASISYDKASDPTYSGGWTNGSNGGVGWGLNPDSSTGWRLFIAGVQSNDPAVLLLASSTSNNTNGDSNADGDIDTAGVAWGMLGNAEAVVAARYFDSALVDGQKFVIEMDNGTIVPGGTEVGFVLQSSDAENRLTFHLTAGSATYQLVGDGAPIDTGVTNTDEGLRIVVEQVNSDTGHVFITRLVDGVTVAISNVFLNTSVATRDIAAVSLFNLSSGGAATNRLFFNAMSILPNPADTSLFADLAIDKTVSPASPIVGSNMTYTVTVTNNGPSSATDVTVTDALPASVTFLSATPTQGTCTTDALGRVVCDLGVMASNDIVSVAIVGTPSSAGEITNIAVVTALNVDNDLTNNEATNIVTVLPAAGLTVSPANHDFGTITNNTMAQTTFVVTNTGGATLVGTATVAVAQFAISSGSPFSISAFGTTNVVVSFTPDSVNAFTDNVIFASNGGDSTNEVTGSGAIVPAASFTGAPTSGLHPLPVTFSDTSTGTITNRFWNFGDSVTTNITNTTVDHQFNNTGTFTVTLIVSGPLGASTNSKAGYITVTNIPPQLAVTPASLDFGTLETNDVANLDFSVINDGVDTLTGTALVTGDSAFTLTSTNSYSIGGGQTATVSVAFSPGSEGDFSGNIVFASNGGNSTNAVTGSGAVPPAASFSGSPTSGTAPLSVNFTDASSGTINGRLWSFGDGGTSTTASPSHNYMTAGSFDVSLTVFGPVGTNTSTRSGYILVTNVVPVAAFTASPTNGEAPLVVTFSDESSGTITNRLWAFGDGEIQQGGLSATHVYTNADAFIATLTVSGPGGSRTATNLIDVIGNGKSSPLGDWEVKIRGADRGFAYLTFSNNATATGFGIRRKEFGLDILSGDWGITNKGKLSGTIVEQLTGATNWTGILHGLARTDKRITTRIVTATNGVFRWIGIPASSNVDLTGTWTGLVTVAKTITTNAYAITMDVTNSTAVFNVAGATATNTIIGQFIVTSRDAMAGYLAIDTNQTTLLGRFKVKESKTTTNEIISLHGRVLDNHQSVKLKLIKQ
ncbi:MAG TPA: PKD domain-containing protein [Verrucomicrobiae bacterium]|nr:PKD domain-containing protein [Verrucomicrobiae bacterium]